ncbi:MAG: long-chain fatty acid--CoA ligase, partial [Deltaproteobacteria bacterium]
METRPSAAGGNRGAHLEEALAGDRARGVDPPARRAVDGHPRAPGEARARSSGDPLLRARRQLRRARLGGGPLRGLPAGSRAFTRRPRRHLPGELAAVRHRLLRHAARRRSRGVPESDAQARVLVTTNEAYLVVEPIRTQTKLDTVVLTEYRDFLPETPTLPPPPPFLESNGGPRPGTEPLLDVLHSAPELKTQVPRSLSDTALLQYTSGTTGTAKAAEITHGNLVSNCELQHVYIGSGDDDVGLGVLPWFHITGMECQMNMMAYMGATLVAIGRFDLVTVLRAIETYRCTRTTFITTVNVAVVNFPKTKEFDLS